MEECEHKQVEGGFCLDCGLSVSKSGSFFGSDEGYSEHHQRPNYSQGHVSYEQDLKNLSLSPEARRAVLECLNSSMTVTPRMGNRSRIIFCYIYITCLRQGIRFQPEKIAAELKLSSADRSSAIKMASGISQLKLPGEGLSYVPIAIMPPSTYLPEIIAQLGLGAYEKDISALCERAIEGDRTLLEDKPRWIAVAVCQYYLKFYLGQNIPRFYEHLGVTPQTGKECLTKVQIALGKEWIKRTSQSQGSC